MKGGFTKNLQMLAQNKIVLYVLLVIALVNIVGYLVKNNFSAALLLVLVGYGMTHLTKNMIYVLLVAILITNFIVGMGNKFKVRFEGFKEGNTDDAESDTDDAGDITEAEAKNEIAINKARAAQDLEDAEKYVDTAVTDVDEIETANKKLEKLIPKDSTTSTTKPPSKPTVTKEGMGQSGVRKCKGGNCGYSDVKDNSLILNKKPKAVLADTVEAAYDNLSNILGSDALKSMSDDTQRLAEKQKALVGQIKGMGPIMNQVNGILKNFNVGDMGGITDLMKNLGGNK